MATVEGKKYEKGLGNLELATPTQSENIQYIYDLKNKVKLISDEISKRCSDLPKGNAISANISIDNEYKWFTVLAGRPKWLHIPVKDFDLTKYPMTKSDKADFDING